MKWPFKSWVSGAAIAAVFINLSCNPASAASPHQQIVVIDDPAWGVPAFRVTVPEGWTVQGTVLREERGALGPKFVYRATSPDGRTTLQKLPRYDWTWSNDRQMQQIQKSQGFAVFEPVSAEEFLKRVLAPQTRPDVRGGIAEPIPGLSQQALEQMREANAAAESAAASFHAAPAHVTKDASRLRLQYDLDGQPIDEWLAAIRNSTDNPMPTFNPAVPVHQIQTLASVYAARAPRGKLYAMDSVLLGIIGSEVATKVWTDKLADVSRRQNQEITARGKQTIAQMQSDLAKWSAQSSAAAQQQIRDTGQAAIARSKDQNQRMSVQTQETVNMSLNQQEYRNPSTGERMTRSNQYNHAWVDHDGNTYYTSSPDDNPNGQQSGTWVELKPVTPLPR